MEVEPFLGPVLNWQILVCKDGGGGTVMPTPGGGVLTPGGAADAENPPPQARVVAMRANTHRAVHWIIVAVLEVKLFLSKGSGYFDWMSTSGIRQCWGLGGMLAGVQMEGIGAPLFAMA